MAHRSIGQDCLDFPDRPQASSSLDDLIQLIDWRPNSAFKGELVWPPGAF